MKKILNILIPILVLLTSTQITATRYFDGQQALNMCQSSVPDMSAGCSMFIVGVAETLRMVGYNGDRYCVDRALDNKQLRQEFIVFLSANPKSLQYSATSLFYASLTKNHPCHIEKEQ